MAKYGVHTYVLALQPYLHTSTCLQTGRQTHKSQSAWCSFVYCSCSAYYFSPNNNSQSLCQNGLLYTPYISVHIYCMYVFTQPVLSWTTLQYANKGCMSFYTPHTYVHNIQSDTLHFKSPCTWSGVLEVNHITVHVRFPHSNTN